VPAWVLAWDRVPGETAGSPNDAEVYVTRVSPDGAAFDAPYRLSNAVGRSTMPALAMGGVYATVWHDNRSDLVVTTYQGDVYAAALSCP
jgi:hypothetical protein